MTDWTDDRASQLKTMWDDGLTASQIAWNLGGVSRNAVIGKVRRMKLPRRTSSPAGERPVRKRDRRSAAASPLQFMVPVAAVPIPAEVLAPDPSTRKTLVELTDETCRWPCGDPGKSDFYFCGAQTALGSPYCGFHGNIAFRPIKR